MLIQGNDLEVMQDVIHADSWPPVAGPLSRLRSAAQLLSSAASSRLMPSAVRQFKVGRFMRQPRQHRIRAALGGQQDVAQLARGATATLGAGLPMHAFGDPRMGIGRGHRKADRTQRRQIGQVIAHERHLFQADPVLRTQRLHAGQLVAHGDLGVDAEVGAALERGLAVARGDQHGVDTVLLQQFQAQAILHEVRLALVAVLVVVQPTVGEGAVHVEAGQADLGRSGMQVGGEGGQGGPGHQGGRLVMGGCSVTD